MDSEWVPVDKALPWQDGQNAALLKQLLYELGDRRADKRGVAVFWAERTLVEDVKALLASLYYRTVVPMDEAWPKVPLLVDGWPYIDLLLTLYCEPERPLWQATIRRYSPAETHTVIHYLRWFKREVTWLNWQRNAQASCGAQGQHLALTVGTGVTCPHCQALVVEHALLRDQ